MTSAKLSLGLQPYSTIPCQFTYSAPFYTSSKASCYLFLIVVVAFCIQSVEGEHHEKAVELLKAAKDSVKLVVRYTPKVLEEMEARFEKLRTARRRQQQQLLIQQQQQQQQNAQQNHMS